MPRISAAKKAEMEASAEIPDDEMLSGFRSALGSMGNGKVSVSFKKAGTNDFGYVNSFEVAADGFNELMDEMRTMFPDGGTLRFRLLDENGRFKTQTDVKLAPLPIKERDRLTIQQPQKNDNELLIAMMNMQQNSSNQMMTMMMTLSTQQQQSMTTMLSAIIPAMAGNKSESAGELLRSMTEAQKNLNPPKENSMAETLQLLQMAKALMPDSGGLGGDDETGFGGLMKGAMPLIASLAQAANQPKPQPAPAQIAQTVAPQIQAPVPQPNPVPQPIHAPQPQPEEDPIMLAQMQLMAKYNPVMNAIKKLLEKGHDEQGIIGYIDQQIEVETVSEEDILNLIGGIEAQPELLPQLLSLWQINDPEHVATVRAALALFVEDDDDTAGNGGNETDAANNGANGDSGKSD